MMEDVRVLTAQMKDRIWELLFNAEPELQQYGLELVRNLAVAERSQIAETLLEVGCGRRWVLAACCLFEQDEALRRCRLFAARCALHRLERRRAAGHEPDQMAWEFIEAAEALAFGRLTDDDAAQVRSRGEEYARSWEYGGDFGPFLPAEERLINNAVFRFEAVPDVDLTERHRVGVRDHDLLIVDPWALDIDEELDQDWAALHAAACSMMPWVWGREDDPEPILSPRTHAEAAWQAHAWRIIVRGGDPLDMVWQPTSSLPEGDSTHHEHDKHCPPRENDRDFMPVV